MQGINAGLTLHQMQGLPPDLSRSHKKERTYGPSLILMRQHAKHPHSPISNAQHLQTF